MWPGVISLPPWWCYIWLGVTSLPFQGLYMPGSDLPTPCYPLRVTGSDLPALVLFWLFGPLYPRSLPWAHNRSPTGDVSAKTLRGETPMVENPQKKKLTSTSIQHDFAGFIGFLACVNVCLLTLLGRLLPRIVRMPGLQDESPGLQDESGWWIAYREEENHWSIDQAQTSAMECTS